MTLFEETLAEISFSAGYNRLASDDSSRKMADIISWAHEFEKIHQKTDWDKKDFLLLIHNFCERKIKKYVKDKHGYILPVPCKHCERTFCELDTVEKGINKLFPGTPDQ